MSQESNYDDAKSITNEKTNGGPGAPKGNFNAWKTGVYSSRKGLVLICRTCAAKRQCPKFNSSNPNQPCHFERFEAPDLSNMSKLCNFLRELIELDYTRYRRGLNFEVLSGGMMDMDVTRLSQSIQKAISTLCRLAELSELEQRVAVLEEKIGGMGDG